MSTHDRVLAEMVARADAGALEVEIVLYIHGMIVSGMLTSRQAYFDMLERIRAAAQDELRAIVAGARPPRAAPLAELASESGGAPSDIIHIRNARITAPGAGHAVHIGWWRGKLAAVDGFSIPDESAPLRPF